MHRLGLGFPDKLPSAGAGCMWDVIDSLTPHADAAPHHICCKLKISVSCTIPYVSGQVILERYISKSTSPQRDQ